MYLVMLRHTMDDIPMFLTEDRAKAFEFAAGLGPYGGEREMEILGLDASTPCVVSLYEFDDKGYLKDVAMIKDFGAKSWEGPQDELATN